MNDQHRFWDDVRRSILGMVAALSKARPNDPFTLEVRIVERQRA